MIYRTLGTTGEKVSAIGLGGHHIGRPKDESDGIKIIRSALDRGMNFLDNCWDYHDGESEIRMGNALRDGYREKAFLMTKFDGRTKESTARQIDESLKRLQTDRIDLMQFHENIRMEDPDRFFASGRRARGAARGEARRAKSATSDSPGTKIRWCTCACWTLPREHKFHFDACQMPLNVMDAHFRSFTHQVVPRLEKEGIAVLGMKPMGDGNVLKSGVVTPVECLHYALSLPTSVVINGCESMERLEQAFEAARTFKPLSRAAISKLLAKTAQAAMTGQYEPFKTTAQFDGTAHIPSGWGERGTRRPRGVRFQVLGASKLTPNRSHCGSLLDCVFVCGARI